MKKRLVILGSTGSIGRSALDVVARNKDRIEVLGLSTHRNIEQFRRQIQEFRPRFGAVTRGECYLRFQKQYPFPGTEVFCGEEAAEQLASLPDADIVLNAIVGAAGLKASLAALKSGKRLALANKESMVIGGVLLNQARKTTASEIIPVDSEHSAIWQALASGKKEEIKKIILTGSGGPFLETPREEFPSITREQALNHPVWKMGPKITVDSATMMNKGLEVIEAVHLFDIAPDKIDVVIHPQSIIHSMVEFVDSSIIAQISYPDMRLPISYALFYPDRIVSSNGNFDLTDIRQLTFQKPDYEKFPLLRLAFDVARKGGTLPAVFNAANEVAVAAFLKERVKFHQIPDIVTDTLRKHNMVEQPSLDDIIEADIWGRKTAEEFIV